MLSWQELKILAAKRGLTVTEISVQLGFTLLGLKKAIDYQRIGAKDLLNLCNALKISPNEFFGIADIPLSERVAKIERQMEVLISQKNALAKK